MGESGEEKDDPFKLKDLKLIFFEQSILVSSSSLRTLLLGYFPIPKICNQYAAM